MAWNSSYRWRGKNSFPRQSLLNNAISDTIAAKGMRREIFFQSVSFFLFVVVFFRRVVPAVLGFFSNYLPVPPTTGDRCFPPPSRPLSSASFSLLRPPTRRRVSTPLSAHESSFQFLDSNRVRCKQNWQAKRNKALKLFVCFMVIASYFCSPSPFLWRI